MKREAAESFFKQGYNCAQSVVLAFKDEIGSDAELVLKIVSPFGGGMGRMREICGAVSGMLAVLGAMYGYSSAEDFGKKANLYTAVQRLMNEFKEKNRSYFCSELLGVPKQSSPMPEKRIAEYYKKRPCASLIGDAADILERYLAEREKNER